MTEDHSVRDLVILGAGPVGLDAALAAAEAEMDFLVLEQGDGIAANVLEWGHVRLFSPWPLNVSSRMKSVLEDAGRPVPSGDPPTGEELVSQLLEPVTTLASLGPRIRTRARAVSVSRDGLLKHEEIGTGRRAESPFRILFEDADGTEHIALARAVLDCTGTWSHPNWLGRGGIPALGERQCTRIVRRVPDFGREAVDWAGQHIILVGAGHSAFTAASGLARLAHSHPDTRVTWVLRSPSPTFTTYDDDPLPARSELVRAASSIASGSCPQFRVFTGQSVHATRDVGGGARVTLMDVDGEVSHHEADRILSLVGSVGDRGLYQQLQIHECYATQGPMKLAASLLAAGGGSDCLAQESYGAEVLASPEPNFYILGSKSYGRSNTFLLRVGFDQVTEVFAELALRNSVSDRTEPDPGTGPLHTEAN